MRVVAFLLCLCFFLLWGKNNAHAAEHYRIGYTLEQHIQIKGSKAEINTSANYAGEAAYECSNDIDDSCFINEDWEDENVNDFFAGKFKIRARTYSALDHASALSSISNRSKAPPFFHNRVSYKYILQRTLRV